MIVDVACEDDTIQIAKTVCEQRDTYIVHFLEKNAHGLYDFVDEPEEVHKDAISGFYDVDELEDTNLYTKVPLGYAIIDDSEDEDYECSDEESDDDDVSLMDEDEDE